MTSITQQLMDTGSWELELDPATPTSVLNNISIKKRLWATYVHTPAHWDIGDLSAANLLSQARFCGTLLGSGPDRLRLNGEDIAWWMGKDGDGGGLYTSTDSTTAGASLSSHLGTILAAANGITSGSIVSTTNFTRRIEGGDTVRERVDSVVRVAPDGPYYWRLNYDDFTLDVDTLAVLWPTATTPTVILAEEGGRDASITSLYAELDLNDVDGSEVRTEVYVDWADGTTNGLDTASLPATYGDLTTGDPEVQTMLDWRPKRPRPPTERWRKVAAWAIASQTRANQLATAEINERAQIRNEVTATLPSLTDPWRFGITPGNTVYLEDIDRGLVDTSHQIYYRGGAKFPTTGRVDEMTVSPDAGGHYLRYYDGVSAFEWLDLTPYVIPGDGSVTLGIDHRSRWPIRGSFDALTKRQRRSWYARAHQNARLDKFYAGLR